MLNCINEEAEYTNDTDLLIKTANEMTKDEEERKKLAFLAQLNINTPEIIAGWL